MARTLRLELDVSKCKNEIELIELIFSDFQFPDLYEKNWLGIKESFSYDPMMKAPKTLVLVGLSELQKNVPDSHKRLKDVLKKYYTINQLGELEYKREE